MRHPIGIFAALASTVFVAMSCNGLVGNDPVHLVGGAAGDGNDAGAGASADESGGTSAGGRSSGGAANGGAGSGGGTSSAGAGQCTGAAECMPSQRETAQQNCGACEKGTQTRSRTCTAQCTWGAWSAWSACNIDVECQPNHYDCCGSNHWHWCLPSSCTWSTDCTPCTAPNCDCP